MENTSSINLLNESLFENYDTFDKIIKSSKIGYLYVFNCDFNGHNELVKFGETTKSLKSRLSIYPKKDMNMRNISALWCTIPDKREKLIKEFLNYNTEYKSLVGTEYYSNEYYSLIKKLLLIVVSIEEKELDFNIFVNKIKDTLNNSNYNDKINYNYIKEEKVVYNCNYCNKDFSSQTNLRIHLKTNKKCIKSRTQSIKTFTFDCKNCNKSFTTRQNLLKHENKCKSKTLTISNTEINIKLIELKNYEKELEQLKIELRLKDEQIKFKDEQLNYKDEQLKYKDEQLNYKDEQLKDKDDFIKELVNKYTPILPSRNNNTTIYQSININQNYNNMKSGITYDEYLKCALKLRMIKENLN